MNTAALRDENERLKALLAQTQAALGEHQAALATSEEARRRLEVILGELRREKFGAKSEKLRPDQYHLPLEDVEIAQGVLDAAQEKAAAIIQGRSRGGSDQSCHRNRGRLPAHLPRVERIIEPASTFCPCGYGGRGPPIVLFRYAPGRSGAFAEQFLDGCNGRFLQCDAYDGYNRLTGVVRPQGPWTLVYCWSHLRRRFVKLVRNSKSPIAEVAVQQIAQLYAIEAAVRGSSPDIRLAARKEHSLPIVAALKQWFEKQLSMISSGSTLAEDICYALNHWQGLTRLLDDDRLELDTNPVEIAIRPICLTRKNALFAGHEIGAENWALLASILATCKLNDVNPVAYIAETLEAIIAGYPQSKIDDLMPWQFRKTSTQHQWGGC